MQKSQNNLERNRPGELTTPNIKTYYKATVIKTVRNWLTDRHTNQWDRIESLEINPFIYGQLTLDKSTKTIHLGKRIVFSTNEARTTGYLHEKRMKVLNIIYKSYLKMDEKIKYQTKTTRLLEENTRVSLHGLGSSNVFLNGHQNIRNKRKR